MQLRITDGTTTVDLSGGTTGIAGCTYFPVAPATNASQVAEQAQLVCKGTTAANIRSALNSVERLCEAARRRYATGKGARVFLEYKPVDTDSLYRSEVYDAHLVYAETPAARRLGDATPVVLAALTLARAPWWDGPEVELQLSAQGQAAATGGRSITNNCVDNWVQIAAAQVGGTEPSPVRLRLTNNTASNQAYQNLYIGLNAFASPGSFGGVHQGEADLNGTGSVALGTCSGGYYRNFGVTSTEQLLARWLLTAAQMTSGGRWVRLLARLAGYDSTKALRIRPVIRDEYGLVTLWEGRQVWLPAVAAFTLVDLGSVPIPPGAYAEDYAQVSLCLKMQASAGTTVALDCIQLVAMDGYRRVEQVGYQVPPSGAVEINEAENTAYYWGGTRWPLHVLSGPGLALWPNTLQRISILHDTGTSAPIANTLSVQAWHRPRRAVI